MNSKILIKKFKDVKTPTWANVNAEGMDLYFPNKWEGALSIDSNYIDQSRTKFLNVDFKNFPKSVQYDEIFGNDIFKDLFDRFGAVLSSVMRFEEISLSGINSKTKAKTYNYNGFYIPNATIIRVNLGIGVQANSASFILDKSSVLAKNGWRVARSSVVDKDYTGEMFVDLENVRPYGYKAPLYVEAMRSGWRAATIFDKKGQLSVDDLEEVLDIKRGMKLVQLVFKESIGNREIEIVDDFKKTERGDSCLGWSGDGLCGDKGKYQNFY